MQGEFKFMSKADIIQAGYKNKGETEIERETDRAGEKDEERRRGRETERVCKKEIERLTEKLIEILA